MTPSAHRKLSPSEVMHNRFMELQKRAAEAAQAVQVRTAGTENKGRRHQNSKTGVSVAPRKGLVSSKIFKKKKKKKRTSPVFCSISSVVET